VEYFEKKQFFDVLFIDWNMPHINGIDASKKIIEICKKQ